MTYYAVIDTNVLVSAMLSAESVPGAIAAEAMRGSIIPLISDEIIAEYVDVLSRRKFHFDRRAVKDVIDAIIRRGIPIDAGPVKEFLPDPKDVIFYQIVMEARNRGEMSDSYLVTGNTKHFPIKRYVVTPRQMLDIIGSNDV